MMLALLVLAACTDQPSGISALPVVDLADTPYDPHPQVPSILRDVAMVDDARTFTNPYVPGHRTTMDGRVALRVQGGTFDIPVLSTHLSFSLFVPEKLEEPLLPGPPGAVLLAEPETWDVPFPPALAEGVFRLGHHAICDPVQDVPVPGERPNPYPCGPGTQNDCYDVTVISSVSPGLGAQLWGTPVTVEVAAPKTSSAHIVDVRLGEPVEGAFIHASTEWTEPAITMDGRLMSGRLGRAPRAWTNPNTGETLIRPYDLAYAVLPPEAEPCDVRGWTQFHPMSHAPYDPDLIGRYGIAAYPFRDTEGNPIPDGEDMGGTYPWVDREGANVFMTGVHGRIAEQSESAYPRRCVHEGCDQYEENTDFDRGFMVAGLWTHGKLVHLDGLINNIDWAVGVHPDTHWMVDLYRDEVGHAVPIRFGSGRFVNAFRASGEYPVGYTHNANVLDSLQHLPNFLETARPVTPRDVVWIMSSGVATEEIAFDDLLDPNAFIVSNMQASITQIYVDGASTSVPYHHNGQVRTLIGLPPLALVVLDPEASEAMHLQNAATSLDWDVPAFGRVEAGTGRAEPVALGGVEGRGFWLSGDNAIVYDLPAQAEVDAVDAYMGVFVDPRTPEGEARALMRFGDGTGIVLFGSARVAYVAGDRVLHEVALPATDGWVHLGWRIGGGHREVTLLHDGLAIDRFASVDPLWSFDGGQLVIGRHADAWTGVRGWLDNLVVLLHDVDVEVACNHAKGTLVAVGDAPEWSAVAARHPSWAHAEVAAAAGRADGTFACVQDHRADYAAHLANLPAGTTSVRAAIHFPEGPVRAGQPRPDSSANVFCRTCHTANGRGGLSLDALAFDPTRTAVEDLRRQPSQPPRRVFGNIPAGWLPGSPDEALQAPPEGLPIDPWVLPP